LAVSALPACHSRTFVPDGGLDAAGADAPGADVTGALVLDFAATGCARGAGSAGVGTAADAGSTFIGASDGGGAITDGGVAACTGTAPLTLTFTPVGSPALTRFRWTFGDDSPPSSDRAPTHTYVLPGTYDVSLVAEGAAGSVSRQHAGFVVVSSNGAGSPCDIDAQCGRGLYCLCGESAPCAGFARGICTSACPPSGCGGAICARVDVPLRTAPAAVDAGAANEVGQSDGSDASDDTPADAPAPPNDANADAPADAPVASGDAAATSDAAADAAVPAPDAAGAGPTPLCLAGCVGDGDCAEGLVCRSMPGTASGTWASVCVPPLYRRVADSCRDAEGTLDDHVCSTGYCADLGAIGMCSAACGPGAPCPAGTACATFGDGRTLCLLTCSTSASCTTDPLLRCETGAGGGALGFTTSPPAPTATFCAPRTCTSQADCAPSGTCKPLGVGAHCVAN
jgi:PKD repeat protein